MDFASKVLPIVKSTRESLLPHYGNVEVLMRKSEVGSDLVTKLDQQTEHYLQSELHKLYSGISFVGEEFGGDRDAERFWLCDPIDGTTHFIRGMPFCTVMLALIERGQVNFSVIYNFVTDEMYHATRDGGAFCNSVPIHVSDRPVRDACLGWETHTDVPENMEKVIALNKRAIFLKTSVSGFEHTMVASGKIDGRICFQPHGKDYDYAPGSLLVSEAGGVVANLGVTTYDYRNVEFIAASKPIYEMLTSGPDALFPLNETHRSN